VTAKAGAEPALEPPLPGEPSLGPTAIMPAVGPPCPGCHKNNHPGVAQCVFCGSLYLTSEPAPPDSSPMRAGWLESPLSEQAGRTLPAGMLGPEPRISIGRPISDAPPASRRAAHNTNDDSDDDLLGPPVADPLIGVVVAERYRIVEPLGRGGMGIVYKVEHIRIGKLLAMKLLTGELSRNSDVVRRFKQEALTASRLSSPNTVQVFDFGVSEGLTYLVMELISGEDLARVLRTLGPMPFARLGKVVIQVCSSLAEAHQNSIVHRDVKPENIMLLRGRDGADVAKVLDFGLAKLREGADLNDVTSQGAIVGTPYFMAPEQIRGEPVDPRSDIYALGSLMYRALTGHYPFNGPTPMAVFTKHLTEAPVPPIERAPELGIPPGVNAIVLKALAKSPTDRFQKVEEVQAALIEEVRALGLSSVVDLLDSGQVRRLAKGTSAPDHKPAPAVEIATRDEVERYERKLRRQRGVAFAFAGVLVVGAVAGAFKLYVHERAELQKGIEIEPNNTPGEATPLPFGTSITAHLGPRLDPTHGDRDFYAVDVPAGASGETGIVALRVTALPNFGMCTLLYRRGFDTALGQYCVGRPGRDLVIAALRIDAGQYFVAVLQDLDPYGGTTPFLHENVSDAYSVTIRAASPEPGEEVEPNDQVASANPIVPGTPMTGTLGWARDVDVFCVPTTTVGAIRWKVRDVGRDVGTVLQVTPMAGSLEGVPVRIHTAEGKTSATDVQSPWQSAPVADDGETLRCLRLRLTNDVRASNLSGVGSAAAVTVPSGGSEPYVVEAEAVP
jgi:eukaryotic-like serine/threonine-protein kinase